MSSHETLGSFMTCHTVDTSRYLSECDKSAILALQTRGHCPMTPMNAYLKQNV